MEPDTAQNNENVERNKEGETREEHLLLFPGPRFISYFFKNENKVVKL